MENKTKQTKKRSLLFRLIRISLIIHIILAIIFLLFAFRQGPIKKTVIPKKREPRIELLDDHPAALKPRKSEFGIAPFDDKAQFKKPKAKIAGPEKLDGITQQKKASQEEKHTKKISPKKQTKKKIARKKKPIKVKTTKAKTKIITSKDKEAKTKDVKNIEEQKDPLNKEVGTAKIKKIEINQDDEKAEQPKIEKFKTLGIDLKDTIPDVKAKKSIIGMTKGFIENLRDEGNDWLKRDGDENKRPDFEDLKHISYQQTILWHLQSTWNQYFAQRKMVAPIGSSSLIHFIIDENGNAENIRLDQSSGYPELDDLFIKLIKTTSPFPPVPKHFNTKKYQAGGPFTLDSRRFNV